MCQQTLPFQPPSGSSPSLFASSAFGSHRVQAKEDLEELDQASAEARAFALSELPFPDHWTKLTLAGFDAGFTHVNVSPGAVPDEFVLRSEAYLQLFLLGTKTTIIIISTDWVEPNLRMKRFRYNYSIDGMSTSIEGLVDNRVLHTRVTDENGSTEQTEMLARPLYPGRAFFLYPVLNGLGIGKLYSYLTYDVETREIKTVQQKVEAYDTSDGIEGRAFKIASNVAGSPSQLWIDDQGRLQREVSMKGMFLSRRLEPTEARETLVKAAFNQTPFYSDFVTVPGDSSIEAASALRINIAGLGNTWDLPSDHVQRCWREEDLYACQITSVPAELSTVSLEEVETQALFASASITSADPVVQEIADEMAERSDASGLTLIESLCDWIARRVRRGTDPVDKATQTLGSNRKSGPLGRTYLYASMARSLGIPTRIANGLVYSAGDGAFIYHSWAESWVDGIWHRVDPAFGGLSVDATHIKLLPGDTLGELTALSDLIGRIRIDVLAHD